MGYAGFDLNPLLNSKTAARYSIQSYSSIRSRAEWCRTTRAKSSHAYAETWSTLPSGKAECLTLLSITLYSSGYSKTKRHPQGSSNRTLTLQIPIACRVSGAFRVPSIHVNDHSFLYGITMPLLNAVPIQQFRAEILIYCISYLGSPELNIPRLT